MHKPVNKLPERLVWWPEEQAIAAAVTWANVPQHQDAKRVMTALVACNRAMGFKINAAQWRFEHGVLAETEKVRHWLAAALDNRRGLPADIAREVDDQLATLRVQVVPGFGGRFGKHRFTETLADLHPRPLAWAALGVALVADSRSSWRLRVGRCLYHSDRFLFNLPNPGQRGPLRGFYCGPGCKVMASRRRNLRKLA